MCLRTLKPNLIIAVKKHKALTVAQSS
ncbi:MAG: BC10 family protein [Hungatella sp.]|nr:BC10 family protein [Hungatella sp.]